MLGDTGNNIVDHLIKSLERQTSQLESDAAQQIRRFMEEKQKSNELLGQILPKTVMEKLIKGQMIAPETYKSATVMFTKLDGFGEVVEEARNADDIVQVLNNLYTLTDAIMEQFDVYKVETTNDAFMVGLIKHHSPST